VQSSTEHKAVVGVILASTGDSLANILYDSIQFSLVGRRASGGTLNRCTLVGNFAGSDFGGAGGGGLMAAR
jgi:hypothetical protein